VTVPQQETAQLRVAIFGKPDCDLCKSARRKVEFFLSKWEMADRVEVQFLDVTTVEGLTESAYHNATDIPTTLVLRNGEHVARWEQVMPPSQELRRALTES